MASLFLCLFLAFGKPCYSGCFVFSTPGLDRCA
ncbi:MAG: hypothetical protein ACI9PN_002559, partial [Candidatus Azotimanducaceae bacterium]